MAVSVDTQLEKAYDDLRSIDNSLSTLTGRSLQERVSRKRSAPDDRELLNDGSERHVQEGGRRITISTDNNERYGKRIRYGNDYQPGNDNYRESRDYSPPHNRAPRRALASSVVMPTIETKSRAAIITEIKKNETKEDSVRNRRLFNNLLVGTLRQFQKDEDNKSHSQIDKQREVELRLEQSDKENKDRMQKEKEELLIKRREKEMEIVSLRRKKAIQQYAEDKLQHFCRLQCFIQTQTKPPLFFLPAKHTLRTLELLKESSKKIEVLIELRRDEMQRELRRDTTASGDEDEGQQSAGVKSSVVVKREQMDADKDDDNDTQSEDSGNEENGVEQDEHPIEAEQNNNAEKDMAEPEAEKVTEEESGGPIATDNE